MTALVPVDRSADAVHVLIIGVGRYDEKHLTPLPGAVLSAKRLAEFWQGCTHAGGRKLGSIEILLSSAQPELMTVDDGTTLPIEPATYDGVGKAFRDWAERCAGGALGVLHWIGHGETVTQTDEAGAGREPGHVLYTEDARSFAGSTAQMGYDWTKTLRGLQRIVAAPTLCFIDACSNAPKGGKDASYSSPWPAQWGPMRSLADVFLSSRPGAKAHCAREQQELDPGLKGGALFSEAIRLALSRYAADDRDDDGGFAVFRELVQRAASKRLERWGRRSRDLRGLEEVFVPQSTFADAIVKLETPFGMIDVTHPGRSTSGVDCHVHHSARRAEKLSCANDLWEADLPYEKRYDARLERRPMFARTAIPVGSKEFDVNSPHRTVKVH